MLDDRVRAVLDRFDDLQSARSSFDQGWRLLGELIAPNRRYDLTQLPGDLRRRRLVDPIGVLCKTRLASFLYGYQLSPSEPWVKPGLLDRDATSEEADWFDAASWRMHAHLSGPTSPIATQLAEALEDIVAAAHTIMFRPQTLGGLPRAQTLPIAECYLDDDGEGRIDTLYREFTLKAHRAAERWPKVETLAELAQRDPRQDCRFVHAIEPRAGGKPGARGALKPWTSTIVWQDKGALIEDDKGFDKFRFSVGRFARRPGEVYGDGPGWQAYPAVYTANRMAEAVLRAAELRVDPVLFGDASIFGGRLDRRAGAFNPVSGAAMFARSPNEVVGRLDIAGDVGLGVEMLERQRRQVEALFYIDWLTPSEGPQKTATEIMDRRDLRLRMLAPLSARIEQEFLNPFVEDIFLAMLKAKMFPPPPDSLRRQDIGFTYESPLSLMQRGQHVDAIRRTFQIAAEAAAFDPSAAQMLRADRMLRDAARLSGIPERNLRSFEELEAARAANAEGAAQSQALEDAKTAGAALQGAAQGVQSLAASGLDPAAVLQGAEAA
jgi:hypothetical protein